MQKWWALSAYRYGYASASARAPPECDNPSNLAGNERLECKLACKVRDFKPFFFFRLCRTRLCGRLFSRKKGWPRYFARLRLCACIQRVLHQEGRSCDTVPTSQGANHIVHPSCPVRVFRPAHHPTPFRERLTDPSPGHPLISILVLPIITARRLPKICVVVALKRAVGVGLWWRLWRIAA